MNEKNLAYLKENLKYAGFADKLNDQLETEIKTQQPEVTLKLETEGEKYHAWIKLDFSEKDAQGNFKRQQYHENYGYNLSDTLNKYPIRELMDEKQKEDLIKALQKGNAQIVTLSTPDQEIKVFVEA